jgi:hypothetical protein
MVKDGTSVHEREALQPMFKHDGELELSACDTRVITESACCANPCQCLKR